jgi:hypothetical protein
MTENVEKVDQNLIFQDGLLGLSRACFGMQCFWGVESSFAKLSGVLRTRGFFSIHVIKNTFCAIESATPVGRQQRPPMQKLATIQVLLLISQRIYIFDLKNIYHPPEK